MFDRAQLLAMRENRLGTESLATQIAFPAASFGTPFLRLPKELTA
jgi:hypothetical protein